MNLKFKIIFLFYFLLLNNSFSQTGWINQFSGVTSNLNSVQFVNSQTGWCVGDSGKILFTSNGGDNWLMQISGVDYKLNSVFFTSENWGQ